MKLHLFLVLKINGVKKIARGGWPGFGMVTVGMDPNTFEVLNGHPNKIPTYKILGGVVQNCRPSHPKWVEHWLNMVEHCWTHPGG